METEFIFWRHATSAGIQVEEICGGEDKSARLWKAMALQVFGENGGERYREIGHYESGAPFMEDSQQRVSISHTGHFMVIAMLPRTPEADLERFSLRTAMGVDCEPIDREQTLRVADRFMSASELELTEAYAGQLMAGDAHHAPMEEAQARVAATVLGWTIKEALYKAALTPGLDFRTCLRIESMPEICGNPLVRGFQAGRGRIIFPDGEVCEMSLFSYLSENHVVTLAYSPKCAKFAR